MDITGHRARGLYWLILSLLSVFLAEVVTGSFRWGVFAFWGVISLIPLYGLHAVILMTLTHRHGIPRIAVMTSAGAVFGLYEAYITKVIWAPYFDIPHLQLLGTDVGALLWVILAYHPLMSFIMPVAAADALCLHTGMWRLWTPKILRLALLNERSRDRVVASLGIAAGLFNGCANPAKDYAVTMLAVMLNACLIAVCVDRFNRISGSSLVAASKVRPNRRQLGIMFLALMVVYALFGYFMRPDKLPALRYHISVWVMYGFFIWLFVKGSGSHCVCGEPHRRHQLFTDPQYVCIRFGCYMVLGILVGYWLPSPLKAVLLIPTIVVSIVWSWWMYIKAVRIVCVKKRDQNELLSVGNK